MSSLPNLSLLLSALLSGLIAGLFYSYSCSVNPGLGKLSDAEYVRAMQSINREILNPVFFASFTGTLLVLPLAAWLSYSFPAGPRFYFLVTASIVYLVAVFGVTMFANVPLNNMLAAFDPALAPPGGLTAHRTAFEGPWNRYHFIRTLGSILTFALVILGILKK
jgi:uncharacterized membrane protein